MKLYSPGRKFLHPPTTDEVVKNQDRIYPESSVIYNSVVAGNQQHENLVDGEIGLR
jgi:hypothetical protein